LESQQHRTAGLTGIAIMMLAADSVAPVPATLVIMYLAAKGGVVAGILGGTLGLSAGVLAAAWFGRTAVGRIAPKFFPEAELTKLREALQSRLALTLACLRSVPVLAETSVILAAATGVPVKKIFLATLGPNLVVAVIYSVSADDSATTAAITFIGTIAASWVLWRWLGREKRPD
jgi:3-dehydroquinate synthase